MKSTEHAASPIALVVDAKANIGESPLWCAADSCVYWIDVKGPALYRTRHPDGQTERFGLPWEIGGFALEGKRGAPPQTALVALRLGLFRYRFDNGRLTPLAAAPFDPRTHRFNETGVDPAGRLWIGTMFDPPQGYDAEPEAGPIYSYTEQEGLKAHSVTSMTANGFAWSRTGDRFYFADTQQARVMRYPFQSGDGRLGGPELFAEIPEQAGKPDGAALDAQGYYWCALHGGGKLRRYSPQGELDREIALPVQNPTMPVFAGQDLEFLYVTSATHGKEEAGPEEGGLLRLDPGVRGLGLPGCGFGQGAGA